MSLPFVVRPMLASERSMVLADWKRDLASPDGPRDWGRGLSNEEFWAILDHVIDHVTLPSCSVKMICHVGSEDIPMAWAAERDGMILHLYARKSLRDEAELAAVVQRELLRHISFVVIAPSFNPILELRR